MIPAEDTYIQIIGDPSQVWATARAIYVPPTDPQFLAWQANPPFPDQELILLASEADIIDMMRSVNLGYLSPAHDPNPALLKAALLALPDVTLLQNAVAGLDGPAIDAWQTANANSLPEIRDFIRTVLKLLAARL